ncbi:NAD(P)-dependent oxidoreductase [Variovorax sp. KK3]|uniref:NAD-dependent epimerase/dehydratase family protein n=1 Tax=Variovorax sp. KK3 TaxID=1855728 RepID=UPI00097BB5FF|nr:GDP-mannose 4,6-dehydratase [Variovorax sp. KK3]
MTRVLLTGSNGALGRALRLRLESEGGFEIASAGRQEADHSLELNDPSAFDKLLAQARPRWVFHLAATFSNDFEEALAINVEATRHLLEAVKRAGSPIRVVLVGSAAEYGAVRPDENPIREDHALAPVSVYGLSKAWQSQLASLYASSGVDVLVARLFNLHAANASERLFVGRVQKQIGEVRAGERTALELGPLAATRDYVSAEQAAEQLHAIAAFGQAGEVYHVASGKPVTMRELLRSMLASSGLEDIPVHEAAALSNRPGVDVPVVYADITKTQRLLQRRN